MEKTTKKLSKMLLVGMAAMVLTFGLVVMGCNTDADTGPSISISGIARVGETLTVKVSNVSSSFSVYWQYSNARSGEEWNDIYWSSSSSLELREAHRGKYIRAQLYVSGKNEDEDIVGPVS